jgi:hypothetical protein
MLLKTFESRRCGGELYPTRWGCLLTLVLACAAGCGPEAAFPEELEQLGSTSRPVVVGNGLNLNGLNLNGLNLNGLNLNGLNLNGLSTDAFKTWFQADPTTRNEIMRYVVACGVPSGESRSFTDSSTNTTYTWPGVLGLAPSWASGNAATTVEKQVVSACMAAHANKFGIHVTISLLGVNGAGNTLAYTSQELTDYGVKEGCFFGNLFDGVTGSFGANDGLSLASNESTARVCALGSQCSPMVYAGSCSQYCTLDSTNTFYTSCSYNGVTYRPITTRMRAQDINVCGDSVCQATESHTTCATDC